MYIVSFRIFRVFIITLFLNNARIGEKYGFFPFNMIKFLWILYWKGADNYGFQNKNN